MKRGICIIVCLIGCLFFASCNCNCSKGYTFYKNSKEYQIGSFNYQKNDITDEIEINWTAGSITIIESDKDTLTITENGEKLPKDQQIHWLVKNGKLTIHYAKSGCLANIDNKYKDLVIEVPKDIELSINTVSANVFSEKLSLSKLDIGSVSANLNIKELNANDFSIKVVSGNVNINKVDTNNFSVDTVSGIVNLGFTTKTKGKINSVSGEIMIFIPKTMGFVVDLNSISGDFISDIPYTSKNGVYSSGKTTDINLEIDTTSANATIRGE